MTAPDKTKRPGGHPSASVESSAEINEDSLQRRRERCLLGCSPGCTYLCPIRVGDVLADFRAVGELIDWANQ